MSQGQTREPTIRTIAWCATLALMLTLMLTAGCGADDDGATTPADVAADGSADGGVDGSSGGSDGSAADAASDGNGADIDQGTADFVARASVRQVFVTHAKPGEALVLRDAAGKDLASGKADKLGSLVLRKIAPGKDYRVHAADRSPVVFSGPLHVLDVAESLPPQSFYADQQIKPGFGYLTTRDGTKLAYFATLPGKPEDGPYPTIVEYSGYDPARPGTKMVSGSQESMCDVVPVLCDAPAQPGSLMAAVAGFATVSVNIRGTGCSGGAFDYFETLQVLDGYDVIETVAAQPWALHHQVGMVGLSYPGISQLFVAKAKPPGLAAIAPMSVIGNTSTTLVPGGILNMGFALSWIDNVLSKAEPYGQGWEQARVDKGDDVCKENQLLHAQRVDNVAQASDQANWIPEIMDPLNPTLFAPTIEVPVLLASSFQDEQTGPFFHTLLDRLPPTKGTRLIVYNGVHSDAFAPQVVAEWKAFLDIYVARRKPMVGGFMTLLVPEFTKSVFGVAMALPDDRWSKVKDFESARAQWEAEPRLHVLVGNGGGDPDVGAPVAQFAATFAAWPPGPSDPWRLYLQPDGSLAEQAPATGDGDAGAASRFRHDPEAGDRGIMGKKGGLWSAKPDYAWKAPAAGDVVAFESAPLPAPTLLAGTASVDLWIRVTATGVDDADLEVNLTELLPDGKERYVQSGWLRASFRTLAATSTPLWPELTMQVSEAKPLQAGQWTAVRIAVPGFAHAFAKGSRLRVAIDTPGDSRADWRFDLKKWPVPVHIDVAHSAGRPSSVVLPRLVGVTPPPSWQPAPCAALRGQPCRTFTATANVPAAP